MRFPSLNEDVMWIKAERRLAAPQAHCQVMAAHRDWHSESSAAPESGAALVPLSVTVIGGLQLDQFAVTRWEDLNLPGIKIGPAGLLDVLSIRGIASGLNFGFEQSAPVFVDGIWFGSSRSSRSGFVDVERIEILKGPQPTHFGKNAIAGAFGVVTRKPQPEFAASLDAYHEFEHDETALTGVVKTTCRGFDLTASLGRTVSMHRTMAWPSRLRKSKQQALLHLAPPHC